MIERMVWLTSQNAARNDGINDGRNSGFEWTMVLDGSTFLTQESMEKLIAALETASQQGKKYFKIPYHRIQEVQDPKWLNAKTNSTTIMKYAPIQGESQIAFHQSSTALFKLGDTHPEGPQGKR